MVSFSLPKFTFGQDCERISLIKKLVNESIESDVYYYLDFKKNEVPESKIFYFDERIKIDYSRFKLEDPINVHKSRKVNIPNRNLSQEESNYVAFYTDLEDNMIMVEVLFNRESYFNKPAQTKYETWRRRNAGMSYLFSFSDSGCLSWLEKKVSSYD